MIKTTPKNLLKVSMAIAVVVSLYIFIYWPIPPLGIQLRNLKSAEDQSKILAEKFKGDSAFKQIKFHQYTAFNGCLSFEGEVVTEDDIHHITNLVESLKIPVAVYYYFTTSNEAFHFTWFDESGESAQWIKPDAK